MNYLLRRQRATALLSQLGLDAVLFIQPENLRYFCGFTGTDGALLLFGNSSIFLTDSRYIEQAGKEVDADTIQEYKNKADGVVNAMRDHNVKRVGFEPGLAYSVYDNFRDKSEDACCWQVLKPWEHHVMRSSTPTLPSVPPS